MIPNRYDGILREADELINELQPGDRVLRVELAHELTQRLQARRSLRHHPVSRVFDIGSGRGNLTRYLLEQDPWVEVEALDVSEEMIAKSRAALAGFGERVRFTKADVLEHLERYRGAYYDAIVSAWTIHNFPQEDKLKVFKEIYSHLAQGGLFFLLDKVYPDDPHQSREMLRVQLNRHRYLPSEVMSAIDNHELEDAWEKYRMDESATRFNLLEAGFSDVSLVDRVERDVVILAKK